MRSGASATDTGSGRSSDRPADELEEQVVLLARADGHPDMAARPGRGQATARSSTRPSRLQISAMAVLVRPVRLTSMRMKSPWDSNGVTLVQSPQAREQALALGADVGLGAPRARPGRPNGGEAPPGRQQADAERDAHPQQQVDEPPVGHEIADPQRRRARTPWTSSAPRSGWGDAPRASRTLRPVAALHVCLVDDHRDPGRAARSRSAAGRCCCRWGCWASRASAALGPGVDRGKHRVDVEPVVGLAAAPARVSRPAAAPGSRSRRRWAPG